MDCNPPGSSAYRIFQAKILEWVAMPSSKGASWNRDQTHISYVSCIGWWVFFLSLAPPGKPKDSVESFQKQKHFLKKVLCYNGMIG